MKIMLISLGCDKNLVDSENMLGILKKAGHTFTNEEAEAEVIVVNSCCFINDAKEESINTILEMAEYKNTGSLKALIVTGCLAERYREEIIKEIPEVDAVLGTNSYEDILEAIERVTRKHLSFESYKAMDTVRASEDNRILTTGGHFAYMKIAEGCNKCCTYCIIPSIRGQFRSIPMEKLIEEAKRLVDSGVKELILVAQETTLYGVDLYGKKMLPELLRGLAEIEELKWIRILYCYPEEITPELIQTIKEEKKVCNYLDLPIQHCNNWILSRMGRKTRKEELKNVLNTLRREIPDLAIRTTLICGFPGETEEMHEELMQFINEMEFDRLGAFAYSPEEGTPAAKMKDQVAEETKQRWVNEVMELQREISCDISESKIGCRFDVMIEGKIADENVYVGRTYRDAPDVDGYFFLHSDWDLMSGEFVTAKVKDASEYDLTGGIVDESAE